MDDEAKPKSLPEKVVRRHADMIGELLPELTRMVLEEGRAADTLLSYHLRTHKELGSRDRRFLSQAVFSYFRWFGWTVRKLELPVSEACLIGAALDSTELNDSFKYLEGRCSLPCPVVPLGEKTLAQKAATLTEWFGQSTDLQPLEISDLVLPDFGSMIDPEIAIPSIEQFQKRPPTWIRSRVPSALLAETLLNKNVPCSEHATLPAAVSLSGGTSLANALAGHVAKFVVQDIAAQCVGHVCSPQEGDDWWDCCAGAGGKALHLIDLMNQNGKVLATDTRSSALKELKKRARKHGIRGIRTQIHNAVRDEPFKKTFDGILVDAPCSGWGTWPRNPEARGRKFPRAGGLCFAQTTP
jgi:16S rRNA (cytosine967-C5)-methyltransferase